jgi:beta-catenin-like protein 1
VHRFIDSEADLDSAIQSLMPLAQSPVLAYPELVKSGIIAQLIDLMSHENVDIVIDVVALLHELTDEDVGDEAESEDADDLEIGTLSKKNEALKMLVDSLVGSC